MKKAASHEPGSVAPLRHDGDTHNGASAIQPTSSLPFEVRSIREEEREACLELWQTVWPGENSDAYFRRYFYGDVDWLPYYTQVGVLDGRLVSAVQICKRIVACGESRLTMGGIANVATLPEFRGRGFNTTCLRAAIRVMEADAMDFSLLFTGIHGYYAREGFSTLAHRWRSGVIRSELTPTASRFAVRFAEDRDLEGLYRSYDSYNRLRPIAVQRTPAYWRDWIGVQPGSLPADLLVAVDRNGELCGYVRHGTFGAASSRSDGAMGSRIVEFAVDRDRYAADEPQITRALLEAVAFQSVREGRTLLSTDLHDEPAIGQAFTALTSQARLHERQSGMVRLLHPENLLRGFTMVWNDRWIEAGRPRGLLRFATPYGGVEIDCTASFVRINVRENADAALPQETLFGLMFGLVAAEQLTDDTENQTLVAALFPRQAATYFGSDGF